MAAALAVSAMAGLLGPALAHATPVRPLVALKDAYEPDDTTATAKTLPVLSAHTFHAGTDQDWSTFTVTETGTPFVVETSWRGGWFLPTLDMFRRDNTTSTGIVATPFSAMIPWGGFPLPTSYLMRAPATGRYYVQNMDAFSPFAAAAYTQYQSVGLARRIDGADRFATAVAISQHMWPFADAPFDEFIAATEADSLSATGCILTTARGFADALAAGSWAGMSPLTSEKIPILLTEPTGLPAVTAAEIKRLASTRRETGLPFTVYIAGGTGAVSEAVAAQVRALTYDDGWTRPVSEVVRVGGSTRFQTAVEIARKEVSSSAGTSDTVFIINAFSFPDALAAAPVAARAQAPILLTGKGTLDGSTEAFLSAHPVFTKAVIVGGSSVVATSVFDALASAPLSLEVTRVSGPTRYDTALAVAKSGVLHYDVIPLSEVVVTGQNFPDGLSATGLTAFDRGCVLLTPPNRLASQVASFYAMFPTEWPSYIVGGTTAISPSVETSFNNLWRMPF